MTAKAQIPSSDRRRTPFVSTLMTRASRAGSVLGLALAMTVGASGLAAAAGAAKPAAKPPIVIAKMGSFEVGGKVLGDPNKASLSCDHGYVEYSIPVHRRKMNVWMWHSSSVAVWKNRWDGGEGFESMFLRDGYPVYLWDGPRVGRANWSCEEIDYKPSMRDQGNFIAWRLGAKFGEWFPGVQFPKDNKEAWNQATRARYDEFDTMDNAIMQGEAAAKAFDKIGPTIVMTNSAGGWRAQIAALHTDNIKAIIAFETPGFVFPEGYGPKDTPAPSPFGPLHVPMSEFKKLTKFPILFVFGDNTDKAAIWTDAVKQAQEFVKVANANGGHAAVLMLPDVGLHGNTHIAFADMNNVAVANQVRLFLKKNGLDGFEAKK